MMRVKAFIVTAALALASTAPAAMAQAPAAQAQVPLIEPAQVKSLIGLGGKITLVDVRRPDEFAAGHIDGAILMPLDTLPNTYTKLPKTGRLIVYCRSGHRSGQAVQFLIDHGYANAVSMNGGFLAWSQH
jgi:rhodanese-related sulfurtransferase